ncbi:Rz1-like lysis system protein LysC [Acinetobacter lwoffii]|uniref:Rz1-like lysis system protein LysC n=1 Tax=Acinetobacter lwoffii TaxID=28090 RepID=UPI00209A72B4|nr:Rz1-like lysis system protein LysC [Acinetobacter lwoffii]MCO8114615.1 Rz1-like lysis system protein LysC [Acinetobacter lwoffii]
MIGVTLLCLSVLSGCSLLPEKDPPIVITRTEYITCPIISRCDKNDPVMAVNGDLLQGYILVKHERDQCSLLVDLIVDCQLEHRVAQSANVEN